MLGVSVLRGPGIIVLHFVYEYVIFKVFTSFQIRNLK